MKISNQRIDKWLFCARFFKTRVLAQKNIQCGKVRINGRVIVKAHTKLNIGDNLSFLQGKQLREIKILSLAITRRPAVEAQELYEDNSVVNFISNNPNNIDVIMSSSSKGRPTKRDRRNLDKVLNRV